MNRLPLLVKASLQTFGMLAVSAVTVFSLHAGEYYYQGASNVWTGTCYVPVEGGAAVSSDALTTDDVIVLKKDQTVYVDDSTIGFFSKVKAVRYAAGGVRAYFHIEQDRNLDCWFGDTRRQYLADTYLVKTGTGKLTFAKVGTDAENYDSMKDQCYNYNTGIDLREGSLALEPPHGTSSHLYRDVIVAEGTTLFGVTAGYTRIETLAGAGSVTNLSSSGTVLNIVAQRDAPTVFSGVVSGFETLRLNGHTYFTGTASTVGAMQLYNWDGQTQGSGVTGFMTLAGKSTPSSLGCGNIMSRWSPFYLKYLGSGETIERPLSLETTATTPSVIDGGANGGLVFTGNFSSYTSASRQQRLLFTSEAGAETCVLSNVFKKSVKNSDVASFYLTKAGAGTWRICERADQELAGVVGVREGVLEFDTIREAGWLSAMGTADLLYGDACDAPSSLEQVPYAHVLGGTNTEGVLDYVGTVSRFIMTRPLALAGSGRLRSEDALLHWKGVAGLGSGERRITVECQAGQTNRLANVTDKYAGEKGSPVVSVAKEGPGDLVISGDLSFSGDLIAKGGGTLTVQDVNGAPYSWYKLTVKETVYTSPLEVYKDYVVQSGSGSKAIVTRQLTLNEFSLYDSNGTRLNAFGNSAWTQEPADLRPGQIALENMEFLTLYNVDKTHVGQLQSGNSGTLNVRWADNAKWLKADDPKTWLSAVVRLQDGSSSATQFDLCYNEPGTDMGRNPTAFSIAGSADGLNWEEVASTNDVVFTPSASLCWLSDGTVANATSIEQNDHRKLPLAHSTVQTSYSVLNKARSVSVEPGTTLKLGADMPVRGLICGTTGLGTIIGGRMESSGALRLVGDGVDAQALTLPADFRGVAALSNVSGWKIFVNGVDRTSRYATPVVTETGITLNKKGIVIVVR